MLIYLLRHGQTEYNAQKRYQGQRDIPLSAAGIAQLRQADFAPEVVYVTPLQRTAQTARVFFPGAKLIPVMCGISSKCPLCNCHNNQHHRIIKKKRVKNIPYFP